MVINLVADRQLIESWRMGNEKAFEQLFQKYFSRLYRYSLKYVSDKSASEEIVMDVMFKVWQKKDTINPNLSFSSYIFKSIANKLIDHMRKQKVKTMFLDETFSIPCHSFIADNRLLQKEMDIIYNRGVDKLSPQKKKVFLMSRLEGNSYQKIATRLSLSRNTVENHMVASLRQLKKYVKEEVIRN